MIQKKKNQDFAWQRIPPKFICINIKTNLNSYSQNMEKRTESGDPPSIQYSPENMHR